MNNQRILTDMVYDQIEAGLRQQVEDWFKEGGEEMLRKIHEEMIDHCATVQRVVRSMDREIFSDMPILLQAAATCTIGRMINERIERSESDD